MFHPPAPDMIASPTGKDTKNSKKNYTYTLSLHVIFAQAIVVKVLTREGCIRVSPHTRTSPGANSSAIATAIALGHEARKSAV